MRAHALLGPSSAHRWLACTPSARVEAGIVGEVGEAAREGTAAHALLEWKLRSILSPPPLPKPTSPYDSPEMEDCTDAAVTYIQEHLTKSHNPITLVEQRVSLEKWVEGGFGTADFIMVSGDLLFVLDFKYGFVEVEAKENPQLMMYGLGVLGLVESLCDVERVEMVIYQPRRENISTYTTTAQALQNWAATYLKPRAALAFSGEGEYVAGEHCRYCKASRTCRTRAETHLTITQSDFRLPPLLSDEEINDILPKLDGLIRWAEDLKEYALQAAMRGKAWNDWKLVMGKTIRRYTDEKKVEEAVKAAGYTDVYKLISITDMEKKLGRKRFEQIIGNLVAKPQGKPTLVPSSDKRQPLNGSSAAEDFETDGSLKMI
ncbi:hypothetical protein FACS1894184_09210 [Clostridia bacterium]|nr:hypothetical protein FACS1894184_09210 [Clostridia bacterium]